MDNEEDLDEEMLSSEDTIDEADYAGDDKEGWIKLSRKDSWVWHYSPALTAVWIYLLRNANYKDGWYKHAYKIKRGQRVTSYGRLSKLCKISYDQARTCIKKLKEHESIIPTLLPDQKLLITICNYESYQGFGSPKSQPKSQPDPNLFPTCSQPDPNDKRTDKKDQKGTTHTPPTPSGGGSVIAIGDSKKRQSPPDPCLAPLPAILKERNLGYLVGDFQKDCGDGTTWATNIAGQMKRLGDDAVTTAFRKYLDDQLKTSYRYVSLKGFSKSLAGTVGRKTESKPLTEADKQIARLEEISRLTGLKPGVKENALTKLAELREKACVGNEVPA